MLFCYVSIGEPDTSPVVFFSASKSQDEAMRIYNSCEDELFSDVEYDGCDGPKYLGLVHNMGECESLVEDDVERRGWRYR